MKSFAAFSVLALLALTSCSIDFGPTPPPTNTNSVVEKVVDVEQEYKDSASKFDWQLQMDKETSQVNTRVVTEGTVFLVSGVDANGDFIFFLNTRKSYFDPVLVGYKGSLPIKEGDQVKVWGIVVGNHTDDTKPELNMPIIGAIYVESL